MDSQTNSVIITISKFISNVFNPLTSLLVYFIYFSYRHYSLNEAFGRFLPLLLILILPLSAWIFWNVKKGAYSNMDVSNRNQRKSLYIIIGVLMLIYMIIYYMLYQEIDHTLLFLFILLLMMQFSNFFIKSSMHTAFNVIAAAFFYTQNEALGYAWLLLAIIVGITRVILKRHTTAEVLMGALLAAIVSVAYIYYY